MAKTLIEVFRLEEAEKSAFPDHGADYPDRVQVVADGRQGTLKIVYYDRQHTGSSFDELTVELDAGITVRGAANLFAPIPERH